MLPGATSSICWAGYCYAPQMMVSLFPLSMHPEETVSGCFGHFTPNGGRGISVMRWIFFNESDPRDSLSVTVHYSTFPSATGNFPDRQLLFSVGGPIPADNQFVISYSLTPGTQGRVELRNLAGKLVSGSGIVSISGTVKFSTTELPSGIYLCTLMVDGKPVTTRKIPVCH